MKVPRLKEWREARGFSHRTLAKAAHTSYVTVYSAEAGKNVTPPTAQKFANVLEVEVRDLMENPPVSFAQHEEVTTRVRKDVDLRWRVVDEALELAGKNPKLFSERARERLSEEKRERLAAELVDREAI
jgi:transcriptional regulator with XRE-family HTH domain